MLVQEWNVPPWFLGTDAGIGNVSQGTGTALSVTTNGPTTENGELTLAACNGSQGPVPSNGTTISVLSTNTFISYMLPLVLAPQTFAANEATSGNWACAAMAWQ